MQNAGAGSADKLKIMGNDENNLSHVRQSPDQPCHLCHTVKIQAAGRFIKYQKIFSADHTDRHSHPLFLTA